MTPHDANVVDPPTVSVLITAYNVGPYIAEAVDSVLAQTYRDFEVIVVDDGSTDNTPEVLARYDGQIRVIHQANSGPAAAYNAALRAARGRFIAFLDGDDAWMPEKLEAQVPAMERNPGAGLSFADGLVCDETGAIVRPTVLPMDSPGFRGWKARCCGPRTGESRGNWYRDLVRENFIRSGTILVDHACVKEVVPLTGPNGWDYELILGIARTHDCVFVDRKLVKYRIRDDSISGPRGALRMDAWDRSSARLLERELALVSRAMRPWIRSRLVFLYGKMGWNGLVRDNPCEARVFLRRCLRHNPWKAKTWAYLAASYCPGPLLAKWRQRQRESQIFRDLLERPLQIRNESLTPSSQPVPSPVVLLSAGQRR